MMTISGRSQQPTGSGNPWHQGYEELVSAARQAPFSGWNFDYLHGRVRECDLPWSYEDLARTEIGDSSRVLDLNTGGGELLTAILHERTPAIAAATESWAPNVPVAQRRLEPLGVEVRPSKEGSPLPAADEEFTLVLNRHGACDPRELARVLSAGGTYLMQGVGRLNDVELNTALDGPAPGYRDTATLDHDATELASAGLQVIDSGEAFAEYGFLDIGAVVYHLMAVSWQVPGFDVGTYDDALRQLDQQIRQHGGFTVHHHRYFIKASRN